MPPEGPGLVKREELELVRKLDAIELSQTEFKFLIDARNGSLNEHGLQVLREAHERQQKASA